MTPAVLWLAAALVAVGVELLTADLVFALIAAGAGAAAVTAALGGPLWLQAVVGGAVALAGIVFVRPVALRHLRRGDQAIRTGVDALPGARARTVAEVTAHDGRIRLRGELWSARLDTDVTSVPIPDSIDVIVTRIDGATALVYPVDPL